jgi:hypothetical protein
MRTAVATFPAQSRPFWHLALVVLLLASAISLGLAGTSATPARAATLAVDQCSGIGPSPEGATTGMACDITVVNTIASNGTTSSTTTLTRTCSLGPCPPGNGTFTTQSTELVTDIKQCNGSGNDAAHTTTCNVMVTNNVAANIPGAQPVTAATVNQCVGSGGGGGGSVICDPNPASTTGATVTQCNGSANGGGGTIDCAVSTASSVSPAVPVTVNQCNGTGNPGGSIVRCRVSMSTNVTAGASATPTASASTRAGGRGNSGGGNDNESGDTTGQVSRVPSGGVAAGAGPGTGPERDTLLAIGAFMLVAAGTTFLLRRRPDED